MLGYSCLACRLGQLTNNEIMRGYMNKRVLIRILFLWLTLINIVNARPLITDIYLDDPEETMLLRQQARLRAASAAIPCSVNSANPQAVSLPIVNTTGNAVDVFWRDSACVEHKYTTVDNGKMIRQPTYLGQVWVLRDPATGALVNKIKVEGLGLVPSTMVAPSEFIL